MGTAIGPCVIRTVAIPSSEVATMTWGTPSVTQLHRVAHHHL